MKCRRTARFKKAFAKLPETTKIKVAKAFVLFQENPQHSSLNTKKIKGTENIWEGRIDDFYRFTFEYTTDPDSDDLICVFRNIGRHDIIDHAP